MHKSQILKSYRNCLKNIQKIKKKDGTLASNILNSIQFQRKLQIKHQQIKDMLMGLENLLSQFNRSQKKAITKVIRIYSNNSFYIDNKLQFRSDYKSRNTKMLPSDIQYQSLNKQQRQYVQKLIEYICQSKPKVKYPKVSDYLSSVSSESTSNITIEQQINVRNTMTDYQLHDWRGLIGIGSQFRQVYQELNVSKQDKINLIINELATKRVFLV